MKSYGLKVLVTTSYSPSIIAFLPALGKLLIQNTRMYSPRTRVYCTVFIPALKLRIRPGGYMLCQRYVAMLDILGFRNLIARERVLDIVHRVQDIFGYPRQCRMAYVTSRRNGPVCDWESESGLVECGVYTSVIPF